MTFGRPHRPLAHRQTTNLISVSISVLCSFRITMGLGVRRGSRGSASYVASVTTSCYKRGQSHLRVIGSIGAPRLHQQLRFSEMKSQIIDRFDCGRACALASRARTRPYGSRRS